MPLLTDVTLSLSGLSKSLQPRVTQVNITQIGLYFRQNETKEVPSADATGFLGKVLLALSLNYPPCWVLGISSVALT